MDVKNKVPGMGSSESEIMEELGELDENDSVDRNLQNIIEDRVVQARQAGMLEAQLGRQNEDKLFYLVLFNGVASLAVVGMLYMVHFA